MNRSIVAVLFTALLTIACGGAPTEEPIGQVTQAAYMSKYIVPNAKLIPTSCAHKLPNRATVTRKGSTRTYTSPSGSGSFASCTSALASPTTIQGRLLGQYVFSGDVDRIMTNFAGWVQVPNLPAADIGQAVNWFYGVRSGNMYVGMVLQYGPSVDVPNGPWSYQFYLMTQHIDNTIMLSTYAWVAHPGDWLYVYLLQTPPSSDWYLYAQNNNTGHDEEFTDRGFTENGVSYILFDSAMTMFDSGVTACNQYPTQDFSHFEADVDAQGSNHIGWTYDGTVQPSYPETKLMSSDFGDFQPNTYPCGFYGWADNVYGYNAGVAEIGWHAEW